MDFTPSSRMENNALQVELLFQVPTQQNRLLLYPPSLLKTTQPTTPHTARPIIAMMMMINTFHPDILPDVKPPFGSSIWSANTYHQYHKCELEVMKTIIQIFYEILSSSQDNLTTLKLHLSWLANTDTTLKCYLLLCNKDFFFIIF